MARISELHYSNAYARSSGVNEFLEIALAPSEDPADFVVGFYQHTGALGLEVTLTDPRVTFSVDPQTGEHIYVLSADTLPILLTDPDGGGATNYEAYALTNTATGTVIDFYDIGGGTQNIVAQSGAAAGAVSENLAVIVGPNETTTTLQFNQPDPGTLAYGTVGPGDTGVACFVAGTKIDTSTGPRLIETLEPGDFIRTRDGGHQPLRWIGETRVSGHGAEAPVLIAAGNHGARRDLRVSPNHRILLRGWQVELHFGTQEALVPAKALVDGIGVRHAPCDEVCYVHLLFDAHQVVRTQGLWSESYFPAAAGEAGWAAETAGEFRRLFPQMANARLETARLAPSARMGAVLRAA